MNAKKTFGRWTKEEHQRFIDGLNLFGKNWKKVEEYVGTRNGAQIRSHAQKFFNRLDKVLNKGGGRRMEDSGGMSSDEEEEGEEEEGRREEDRIKEEEEEGRDEEGGRREEEGERRMQEGRREEEGCRREEEGRKEEVRKEEERRRDEEGKRREGEGGGRSRSGSTVFLMGVETEKKESNKREMLSRELNLLFCEENISRIHRIIRILKENYFANEPKEEANKATEIKLPNMADIIDLKRRRCSIDIPPIVLPPETDKDALSIAPSTDNNIICLKRKGSLDESLLQKKIKKT